MKKNRTLFVLALGIFGITTTEFGVIGILPEIASAFAVSMDKAGLLLSAFAIVVALSGPFIIIALSSFDRKKVMVFSLLIFTITNVLSALVKDFHWLLFIRMLPACFHPVYWSVALSVAAKSAGTRDASRAVSIVFSGLTIATVLGVPLATLVSNVFNWQTSFLLSALINLIAMLGILCWLPPIGAGDRAAAFPAKEMLKNGRLWVNVLLAFMMITAMYATYGYMADFLKTVSGMNGKAISGMLLLFGIMGVVGNRLAGKYMGRFPYQTTLVFILLLTLSHLLLYYLGSFLMPAVLVVGIWGLIHAGGFLISNINVTAAADNAPEFINSIFTSCGNFAVTAGSLLGGYWISTFGIHEVVWSSMICLIVALLILLLREKLLRKRETTGTPV